LGKERILKTVSESADVTFCGSMFHTLEAATGKAQSPMLGSRVRGTTSDDDEAERKR